jgi:hypothetical protein
MVVLPIHRRSCSNPRDHPSCGLTPRCRKVNLLTDSPYEAAGRTLPCVPRRGHEDDLRAMSC